MSPILMPAAFIGHGTPMNALEHNRHTAAWQAFCNADTATPGRWIGHHSATGTVEAHHLEGQIVVPRRSTRAGRPGAQSV